MSESPPKLFFLHPENGAYLRKQIDRPKFPEWSVRDLILLALLCLFTLIIALVLLVPAWKRWYDLENNGTTTQATVTGIRFEDREVSYFYVTYGFTATDGQFHEVEQRIDRDKFELILANDQNLTVRYNNDNPQVAELTGRFSDSWGDFRLPGTFIAVVLLILWGGVLAIKFDQRDRNTQLLQNHQLVKGRVLDATSKKPQEDSALTQLILVFFVSGWYWLSRRRNAQQFTVAVHYQFKSPDGEVIEKWERNIRNDLDHTKLPPQNTPVAVLFRNKRHFAFCSELHCRANVPRVKFQFPDSLYFTF